MKIYLNRYNFIITLLIVLFISLLVELIGAHFVSAATTCAPKTKEVNGTRVYHYSPVEAYNPGTQYDNRGPAKYTATQYYTATADLEQTASDCTVTTYNSQVDSGTNTIYPSSTFTTSSDKSYESFTVVYNGNGNQSTTITFNNMIPWSLKFHYTKEEYYDIVMVDGAADSFGASCHILFSDGHSMSCASKVTISYQKVEDTTKHVKYSITGRHSLYGFLKQDNVYGFAMKSKKVTITPYAEVMQSENGIDYHGIYMDTLRQGVYAKETFQCVLEYYGELADRNCKDGMLTTDAVYGYTLYVSTHNSTQTTQNKGLNHYFKGQYQIDSNVGLKYVKDSGIGKRDIKYYYKHTSGGNAVSDTAYQRVYYPTKIIMEGPEEARVSQLVPYDSIQERYNLQTSDNEKTTCLKEYGDSPSKHRRYCIPASPNITMMKDQADEAAFRTLYPGNYSSNNKYFVPTNATFTHHFGFDYTEKPMYYNSLRPAPHNGGNYTFKEKDGVRRSYFVFTENGVSDNHYIDYYYITKVEITPGEYTTENDYIAVNETHGASRPTGFHGANISEFSLYMLKYAQYELTDIFDEPECRAYYYENKYDSVDCTSLLEMWYNFPYDQRGADDLTERAPQEKEEYFFFKDERKTLNTSGVYKQGDSIRYQRYAFQDNGHNAEFFLKFVYANKVSGNISKPLSYSDTDWGEYRCTVHYPFKLAEHPFEKVQNVERIIDEQTRDCWYRVYQTTYFEPFPITNNKGLQQAWDDKNDEAKQREEDEDTTYNKSNNTRNIVFQYMNNGHLLRLEQTRIYAEKVEIMNYIPKEDLASGTTHPSSTGKSGSKYDYYCYVYWGIVPSKITKAKGVGIDNEAEFINNYNAAIRTKISDISNLDGVWKSEAIGDYKNAASYIGDEWMLTGHHMKDGTVIYPDKLNQFFIVDNIAKTHRISCTYQDFEDSDNATHLELRTAKESDYDAGSYKIINSKLTNVNMTLNNVQIITDTQKPVIGNEPNSDGVRFQKNLKYPSGSYNKNSGLVSSTRSDNQYLAIMHNNLRHDLYFSEKQRFFDITRPISNNAKYDLIGLEHMYIMDVTYADIARDSYKNSETEIDTFVSDNNSTPFIKTDKYSTNIVSIKDVKTKKDIRADVVEEKITTNRNLTNQNSYYIGTDSSNYNFEKSYDGTKSANSGMYEDMAMINMNYQTNHWYDFQICILWSDKKGDSGTANWNGAYFDNSTYLCYKGGEEDIKNGIWSYTSKYNQFSQEIELHSSETLKFKDGTPYSSYIDGYAYDSDLLISSGLSNSNVPYNAMDHRTPNNGWNNIRFDLFSEYELRAPHNNNPDANRNYVADNYWSRQPAGILIVQDNLLNDSKVNTFVNSTKENLSREFALIKSRISNITSEYGKTQTHQAWLIWDDGNYIKNNGEQKIKDIVFKADGTLLLNKNMNPWKNSKWVNINNLPNTQWEVKEVSTPLEVSQDNGLKLTYNEFEAYESFRTVSVSWGDDYRIFESNGTNPYWDFVQQSIVVNLGVNQYTGDPSVVKPDGCNVDIPRQGCLINKDSIYLPTKESISAEMKRIRKIEIEVDVTGVSKGTGY